MTLSKEGEETKEQWHFSEKDAVRVNSVRLSSMLSSFTFYGCIRTVDRIYSYV